MTLDQLRARLARAAADVPREVDRSLALVGSRSARVLRDGMLSGARLGVRTGFLRNSASVSAVTREGGGAAVEVSVGRTGGDPLRYARIHEEGGTITPRRGKYLAIPVGAALTASGVTRQQFASPRAVEGLFVHVGKGGQPMLARQVGKGKRARIEVLYLLRRSVRVRGKHYMRDTRLLAEAALPQVIAERLHGLVVAS